MRCRAALARLFMYSGAPMADQSKSTSGGRRSAVYSYLRPVVAGRRVLEIGCGNGDATALLLRLGAKSALGAGSAKDIAEARARHRDGAVGFVSMDPGGVASAGSFDLVVVPDAADLLRDRGPIKLSALLALVSPGGRLACIVQNGDQGEGVPYFDVVDALTPHFSKVRMFGQTPFFAYGIAEFDEAAAELRVESDLADSQAEPSHYIALAGPDEPLALGYALVQILPPDGEDRGASERPTPGASVGAPDKAGDASLAELRQKLAESEGKAEGLLRVSRAQAEEIEELRARLRRTAEARGDLDEEVRRLRGALIEADESVVNLTRKTTEEMTSLAQRLTAGLRAESVAPSPALAEELRRRESELAERESALSERDDRIASLEVARQEALWRADSAEDELARVRSELTGLRTEQAQAQSQARSASESEARLKAQEATIDELLRAAAAHAEEVNRLRDAANEQASLVTELEDALRECEKRLADKVSEAAQLQKMLTEVEDEERVRRSRLAELEGLMLRAEHASARESEMRGKEQAMLEDLRGRLGACQGEGERLRGRIADLETALAEATPAPRDDARMTELETELRAQQDHNTRLGEQEARLLGAQRDRDARLGELEAELLRTRQDGDARVGELEAELLRTRQDGDARVGELEAELLRTRQDHDGRVRDMEAELGVYRERDQRVAELRADAPDPEEVYDRLFDLETQYQAATMAAARVPELEAKVAELEARLANAK
jgi:chromosome segregation ATPase